MRTWFGIVFQERLVEIFLCPSQISRQLNYGIMEYWNSDKFLLAQPITPVFQHSNCWHLLLGSLEEIDAVPFLQGNDGLLPIRPLPVSSS